MESLSPRFRKPAQHCCPQCREESLAERCGGFDPHKESDPSLWVDLDCPTNLRGWDDSSTLMEEEEFLLLPRGVQEKVTRLIQRLESLGVIARQNYIHLPTVG